LALHKTTGYLNDREVEAGRFPLHFFKVIDHARALFRDRLEGPYEPSVS
jgi:hypothetical protein